MSTWANSGLAHAALTGAMLALGRTTPPVAPPDATTRSRRSARAEPNPPSLFDGRELPEPRWPGRALPEAPPGRYRDEAGAGLRYPTSPTGPEAIGVGGHGVIENGVIENGVGGSGVIAGSTRPVNPTDGFLAGSVTALAAAPIPVWDTDGAAIGAWSDSGTLASVQVVPAPPLPELSPVSDQSPLGLLASAGFASLDLDGEPLGPDSAPSSSDQPWPGTRHPHLHAGAEQVESAAAGAAVDSAAVDRAALGSLDSSGLFVALSRLPTSNR